jgi:Right handed beta helix region
MFISNSIFKYSSVNSIQAIQSSGTNIISISGCQFLYTTGYYSVEVGGEKPLNLSVDDCLFEGNDGGIALGIQGGGIMQLSNSIFRNNVYSFSALNFGSSYGYISNVTFTNTTGSDALALIATASVVTISNTTISNSSVTTYGTIYSLSSTVTFSNTTLTNNRGPRVLFAQSSSNISLSNSTLTNNQGIPAHLQQSSGVFVACKFDNNSAPLGAGLYVESAIASVYGSTFANNSASMGGGFYVNGSSSIYLIDTIFTSNSASSGGGGGGFISSSTLDANNVTFSYNLAQTGAGIYIYNATASVTNCNESC